MEEERLPSEFDFDGIQVMEVEKAYSMRLPSGDVQPPLPVRITHFMQPYCNTYGAPTRKMLFDILNERPFNTFLELRETVMREKGGNEALGKSVIGGWSIGVDRDLKDDTRDIYGARDELRETGAELICPFTRVTVIRNGEEHDVLRLIGADEVNNFEYFELLLRLKLDDFSNVQNTARLYELTEKHERFVAQLMKKMEEEE